jgi:hypothetical protein
MMRRTAVLALALAAVAASAPDEVYTVSVTVSGMN